MEYTVNKSTSVIQIDGSTAIVYLSTAVPDQFVTVRDATGQVSSVVFSSLGTIVGDPLITQPFGYVSLVATTPIEWTVVNQDPFSHRASTIRALDAFSVRASTISSQTVSTSELSVEYLTLSSITGGDASFANINLSTASISAGNAVLASLTSEPLRSDSLTAINISGTNASVGNIDAGTIAGRSLQMAALTANSLSLDTISASVTASTFISEDVTGPLTASTVNGTSLDIGPIQLFYNTAWITGPILGGNLSGDIFSYELTASTIQLQNFTGSPALFQLGATKIENAMGSLDISSISTQSLIGTVDASSAYIGTISASTFVSTDISGDSLSVPELSTIQFSTSSAYIGALVADDITTTTLTPSSFSVSSSLAFAGTQFYIPEAALTCKDISAAEVRATSLTGTLSANRIIADRVVAPTLQATDIQGPTTTATASSISVKADQIIVGSRIIPGPTDASVIIDALSDLNSPPYQTASGTGTFRNPFITTNVNNTLINFAINGRYLNVKFRHTNLPPPDSGLNGGTFGYVNGTLIYYIDNIYRQPLIEQTILDIDLSGFPVQGINPVTGDSSPYFVWNVLSSSVTTDQLTLWVSNNLNAVDLATAADVSGGITIRKGILTWPSTCYGVTIQNPANDIQTRSLFYTGSLQNVSDRALKRIVGPADLSQCTNLPTLYRYQYRPDFHSTFQIQDGTRLGILATDESRTETVMGEQVKVVSRDAMRFQHLGATKYLMEEVKRLRLLLGRSANA